MKFGNAIKYFTSGLAHSLPGMDAQYVMAPAKRKSFSELINEFPEHRKSAVMILLYPDITDQACMLLIERPSGNNVHSGQIALPGGRIEEGETVHQAALRETEEETGIPRDNIAVLGNLTEIFIPASRYAVQPVVGITEGYPRFNPNPAEVKSLIELPLDMLLTVEIARRKFQAASGYIEAPCFEIDKHAVWGATAMILSEVRELLKQQHDE